jgi:hypothetical protein
MVANFPDGALYRSHCAGCAGLSASPWRGPDESDETVIRKQDLGTNGGIRVDAPFANTALRRTTPWPRFSAQRAACRNSM